MSGRKLFHFVYFLEYRNRAFDYYYPVVYRSYTEWQYKLFLGGENIQNVGY